MPDDDNDKGASQGSDIYSSDIAGADETTGGVTTIRDDGTSHSTQYGNGWHYSWGTSDDKNDQGHVTIHGDDN